MGAQTELALDVGRAAVRGRGHRAVRAVDDHVVARQRDAERSGDDCVARRVAHARGRLRLSVAFTQRELPRLLHAAQDLWVERLAGAAHRAQRRLQDAVTAQDSDRTGQGPSRTATAQDGDRTGDGQGEWTEWVYSLMRESGREHTL